MAGRAWQGGDRVLNSNDSLQRTARLRPRACERGGRLGGRLNFSWCWQAAGLKGCVCPYSARDNLELPGSVPFFFFNFTLCFARE